MSCKWCENIAKDSYEINNYCGIVQEGDGFELYIYEPMNDEYTSVAINYCPNCGRKLEVKDVR